MISRLRNEKSKFTALAVIPTNQVLKDCLEKFSTPEVTLWLSGQLKAHVNQKSFDKIIFLHDKC